MQYHVNRDGQDLGIFSLEQVRSGYQSGQFSPRDLVWREGMTTWIPLAELPELARPDSPGAATPGMPEPSPTAHRDGPPWEQPESGGVLARGWETIKGVLINPTAFFSSMRTEGGLGPPLLFYLLFGTLFGILGTLIELPFQTMYTHGPAHPEADEFAVLTANPALMILLLPLFIVVLVFIDAAITHLCLMLVGGARNPFETTFRVCAYASGAIAIVGMVPMLGGLISMIWIIVAQIIGLAAAHVIPSGKAALAVLLPLLFCCGAGILLAFGFGLLRALAA